VGAESLGRLVATEASKNAMGLVRCEKGDTWPKILKRNFEGYGDKHSAMRYKHYGIWQPYTWKDYYSDVKYLALGLLSLGFEAGDRLLIVGDNAPQWYCAELAAQANLGVSVGVYSDLTPPELAFIAGNSEAAFAIVEDQEQVDKLIEIRSKIPRLKQIVYWNYKGLSHYADPFLMGYNEVLKLGKEYEGKHNSLFEKNVEAGNEDDICAIVYTSGTTGPGPKPCIHTHKTIRANANCCLGLDPWFETDNVVPFLPPAWLTEQVLCIGCHLLTGNVLNFAERPETHRRDNKEISPAIVFHGTRLWETQAASVQARISAVGGLKRLAFNLLLPIGKRMADLRFQKKTSGMLSILLNAAAEALLFRPVRRSLGLSNARICYSTGTLLSPETLRFFHSLGIPLKSLYGTTEGGLLAGAGNDDVEPDTVGLPFDGTEVRLSDGEILYKHPGMFAGYYKDPAETARVLEDGWFHSGDSGFVREDGHLVMLDREENLVELPSGERLAPQSIESRLRFNPYIRDAWIMAGPGSTFISAVIVINYDAVGRWAGQKRIAYSTFAELSQQPEVYELVGQGIDRVNSTLPDASRVKRFVNLHSEFDPDEGELTRTRKLRRGRLKERYSEVVDAIYGGKSEVLVEADIRQQAGRTGARRIPLAIVSLEGAGS
jgi:long-chain acyl-CoA synthetase